MAERETKITGIRAGDANIPLISFAANPNATDKLTPEYFDINTDNGRLEFTAFYDSAHRLIFVLDKTIDSRTPNTLLIISPDANNPERKWDDILANDYNLDLETIRPKIDNKYQKLDIEYTGLPIYNKLINAHNSNDDISNELSSLSDFRNAAAVRAAQVRLDVANNTIRTAGLTIDRAERTMAKLAAQGKSLREKLTAQKKKIGKEPAKQSAAKILKLESQIDSVKEKSKRTMARLKHARKRLDAATSDAEISRQLLDVKGAGPITEKIDAGDLVMAEDAKVKPLVEKNPEILDEKIAFRPIDFDITETPKPKVADKPVAAEEPAKFDLPVIRDEEKQPVRLTPPPVEIVTEPPQKNTMANFFDPEEMLARAERDTPEIEYFDVPPMGRQEEAAKPTVPESPTVPSIENKYEPTLNTTEVPPATDATTIPERPVSPTGNANIAKPAPINAGGAPIVLKKQRPSAIYYVMLVLLIALSIFTLWLYQKKSGDSVPNLTAAARVAETTAPVESNAGVTTDGPFVAAEFADAQITEPTPDYQTDAADTSTGSVDEAVSDSVYYVDDYANATQPNDGLLQGSVENSFVEIAEDEYAVPADTGNAVPGDVTENPTTSEMPEYYYDDGATFETNPSDNFSEVPGAEYYQ